ncbi:MAG: helix-hairpin-helix domain-containing protein [Ruminiclostridium sp.]|nr:helix-hairpin-helix domain-containing protein [Ruminiclostridium sp.]
MKDEYKRFIVVVIATCVILFALFLIFAKTIKADIENENLISYNDKPTTSGIHYKKPDAVELNEATYEELSQVEGIGRELAHDILLLREKLGRFTSVNELMLISGMDKETLAFIKEKLYVEEEWNRFNEEQNSDEKNKVNINTATVRELMTLDAITEGLAMKIVEYRQNNGDFVSINEIKNVDGIGDGIFNSICDDITV